MKSVIIGLGNPIVGDDAIGIRVAEYIKDTSPQLKDTTILSDISIAGIGIVELFRGYDKVILIDSIQTGKYPIGTVVRLQPEEFSLALHTSDYHNMDIFTALEFSNQMYDDITEDITIIGIEIINPMEFSDKLSLELHNRFEEIVNQVSKIVFQEINVDVVANVF